MEHEHGPSLEREQSPELPEPIFDLEQMAPEQVANLVAAVGATIDAEHVARRAGKEPEQYSDDSLIVLIGRDLKNLVARDLEKAMEIYVALMNYPALWPRELAADFMGAALLHRYLHDQDDRQRVIGPWLKLLDHESEFVREAAERSISEVVNSDWIDEPTARYLDSKLPAEWQREDWWVS